MRELQEAIEMWQRVFFATLHDLRNPLYQISAFSELIGGDPTEEERKEILEGISTSSERIKALFEELTSWGEELVNGSKPEAIDLSTTISEVTQYLQDEAIRKGITVRVLFYNQELPFMFCKKVLSFAIRNIVANAIKFTDRGGMVDIYVTKPAHNGTRISILDSGIGIPRKRVKELFSPVKSEPDTEGKTGSGIGLTLVKFFIEKYGGSISVQSTEGGGTAFFLDFPKGQAL